MVDDLQPLTDQDFDRLIDGQSKSAEDAQDQGNPFLAGWEFSTLSHAYLERPPQRELVTGIVGEASLNLWYGAPGSKKSLLLADLFLCVAAGMPWLEHLPDADIQQRIFQTVQTPARWLDFDNGTYRSDVRFSAFGKGHSVPSDSDFSYISIPAPRLDMSLRAHAEWMARLIDKGKIGLLAVDNLSVTIGKTEENASEMADVMNNWRWIVNSTGASVNIIHHQRKSSPQQTGTPSQTSQERAESVRGHSSILSSLDQAFHIAAVDGEDSVILTPAKKRDGIDFANLTALFTYDHFSDEDRRLMTARFYGHSRLDARSQQAKTIEDISLDLVRKTPGIGQGKLVQAIKDRLSALGHTGHGFGRDQIRGALVRLVDDGRISAVEGTPSGGRKEVRHYAED